MGPILIIGIGPNKTITDGYFTRKANELLLLGAIEMLNYIDGEQLLFKYSLNKN